DPIDHASGQIQYAAMFYSDYTYYNTQEPKDAMEDDGDFYTMGIEVTAPGTQGDYPEVNYYDLATAFGTGSLPVLAIATASNSGYGNFAVWYDGAEVKRKLRLDLGHWKPGKSTAVGNISTSMFSVYPNPVVNDLSVTNIS